MKEEIRYEELDSKIQDSVTGISTKFTKELDKVCQVIDELSEEIDSKILQKNSVVENEKSTKYEELIQDLSRSVNQEMKNLTNKISQITQRTQIQENSLTKKVENLSLKIDQKIEKLNNHDLKTSIKDIQIQIEDLKKSIEESITPSSGYDSHYYKTKDKKGGESMPKVLSSEMTYNLSPDEAPCKDFTIVNQMPDLELTDYSKIKNEEVHEIEACRSSPQIQKISCTFKDMDNHHNSLTNQQQHQQQWQESQNEVQDFVKGIRGPQQNYKSNKSDQNTGRYHPHSQFSKLNIGSKDISYQHSSSHKNDHIMEKGSVEISENRSSGAENQKIDIQHQFEKMGSSNLVNSDITNHYNNQHHLELKSFENTLNFQLESNLASKEKSSYFSREKKDTQEGNKLSFLLSNQKDSTRILKDKLINIDSEGMTGQSEGKNEGGVMSEYADLPLEKEDSSLESSEAISRRLFQQSMQKERQENINCQNFVSGNIQGQKQQIRFERDGAEDKENSQFNLNVQQDHPQKSQKKNLGQKNSGRKNEEIPPKSSNKTRNPLSEIKKETSTVPDFMDAAEYDFEKWAQDNSIHLGSVNFTDLMIDDQK